MFRSLATSLSLLAVVALAGCAINQPLAPIRPMPVTAQAKTEPTPQTVILATITPAHAHGTIMSLQPTATPNLLHFVAETDLGQGVWLLQQTFEGTYDQQTGTVSVTSRSPVKRIYVGHM